MIDNIKFIRSESIKLDIHIFNPKQEISFVQRCLPHWSQSGTISFVTWRTWDSIPEDILQAWIAGRDAWLGRHGIDPSATDISFRLKMLAPKLVMEFHRLVSGRWNEHLDAGHGACVLRQPQLSKIVADSLQHFDGVRYELTDYVIMPNHVHIMAAFPCEGEGSMLSQCESWKRFTAVRINRVLNRKGRFWQQDSFDHLVRSERQFEYLRRYIAANPRKAGLRDGEYFHKSKLISPL